MGLSGSVEKVRAQTVGTGRLFLLSWSSHTRLRMSAMMAGTEEDGRSAWDMVGGKGTLRGDTSADV